MKVLVVGQGGREHALAWKLSQSPSVEKVFCAPGNAGTAREFSNVRCSEMDARKLVEFAHAEKIGLTVIGPEAPLVAGVADVFRREKLNVFGPSAAAAKLEGSKIFSKEIMRAAGVPTADWRRFDDAQMAMDHVNDLEGPCVVKADGLAAGKGVFVCGSPAEARSAIHTIMKQNAFGEAGNTIVVEECLDGQEASILAIVDGTTIVPLAASQDHKRAGDGDTGPNTGGMGAYCPAPIVTDELMDDIAEKILVPTVHEMKISGTPFSGILYAGLMLTKAGPKVLEFNVRMGDPETQPVLMRLKSDLAAILLAAATGKLEDVEPLEWDPRPSICVVMASKGYPGSYEKGHEITGLEHARQLRDVKVFHAGTTLVNDKVTNSGGRVLGVTALGEDLAAAKKRAYEAVAKIHWQGGWSRSDIGDKAL